MKTRDNFVQLKRFQVREKSRQLGQLDLMIGEFERMAQELDVQIAAEEKKAGITDLNHFAYPTFAKAARQRRDNLLESRSGLEQQREAALRELAEAETELARAELLDTRDNRGRDGDTPVRRALAG